MFPNEVIEPVSFIDYYYIIGVGKSAVIESGIRWISPSPSSVITSVARRTVHCIASLTYSISLKLLFCCYSNCVSNSYLCSRYKCNTYIKRQTA